MVESEGHSSTQARQRPQQPVELSNDSTTVYSIQVTRMDVTNENIANNIGEADQKADRFPSRKVMLYTSA